MLNELEFSELTRQHPELTKAPAKQLEILRDQLKPGEKVIFADMVEVTAGPGLVCVTETDLYLLWTQKMFLFFKFPAIQTFHRVHLKMEPEGNHLQLRAGEEENRLSFASVDQMKSFQKALGSNPD